MEGEMLQKEKRGNVSKELKKLSETVNVESELQDIDLYKLLKVYQKVLNRFELDSQKPKHEIVQYPYTIEDQKVFILKKISEKRKLSFTQIVEYNREKIGVIYNFLAILELLQLNQVNLRTGEGYNNFWITRKELAN